jgi:hypothetical protein
VLAALALWAAPAAATTCPPGLCAPIIENGSWRHLVMDPAHAVIEPARVSVLHGSGSVTDAAHLVAATGRPTTITASSGHGPTLLLDMGADVGGRVEVRAPGATCGAARARVAGIARAGRSLRREPFE